MDTLNIERFGVMCWSGGGPSSYRLAAKHGDRVSALVALAALTMHYEFGNGINSIEYSLLTGSVGNWLLKEMAKHMPKTVVGMVASEEGDLTKEQAHALSEHIWNDETKREFVLKVSATISGRHDGLKTTRSSSPKLATWNSRASRRRRCSCTAPPTPTCTRNRARTASRNCPTRSSCQSRTAPTSACGLIRRVTRSRGASPPI